MEDASEERRTFHSFCSLFRSSNRAGAAQHEQPMTTDGNDICSPSQQSDEAADLPPPMLECAACNELASVDAVVSGQRPCPHYYCAHCFGAMLQGFLDGQHFFSPSCCGMAIPSWGAAQVLTPDVMRRFQLREAELACVRPVYCHVRTCSAFIPAAHICESDFRASCGLCHKDTCVSCRQEYHPGADCPDNDDTAQQTLRLAAENRWMRCPRCHMLIERQGGCNHIICRCRYEFCYLCGCRWLSCSCLERPWERARDGPEEERLWLGLTWSQIALAALELAIHIYTWLG